MLKFRMVPDFSGVGRWRGGPGVHWEAVNEGSDGKMATGSSDGDETLGAGAQGGGEMPPCRTYLRRDGELIRVKPHRMVDVKTGDVLVKHSAGGGGVGNPAERDPEAVRDDLRNGLVSAEAALEVYRVAINAETFLIDDAETQKLRGGK
jgi:N-methylhydantoinase B